MTVEGRRKKEEGRRKREEGITKYSPTPPLPLSPSPPLPIPPSKIENRKSIDS
ncbi:MAG: hypothetical protein MUE44_08310 [Oscillatoriaceae cyanobacterium Prado104]|nr:hypothetical protein [Oscillatoriaceae cyanobacterium Prado104]